MPTRPRPRLPSWSRGRGGFASVRRARAAGRRVCARGEQARLLRYAARRSSRAARGSRSTAGANRRRPAAHQPRAPAITRASGMGSEMQSATMSSAPRTRPRASTQCGHRQVLRGRRAPPTIADGRRIQVPRDVAAAWRAAASQTDRARRGCSCRCIARPRRLEHRGAIRALRREATIGSGRRISRARAQSSSASTWVRESGPCTRSSHRGGNAGAAGGWSLSASAELLRHRARGRAAADANGALRHRKDGALRPATIRHARGQDAQRYPRRRDAVRRRRKYAVGVGAAWRLAPGCGGTARSYATCSSRFFCQ